MSRKVTKKLELIKQTVAKLDEKKMKEIQGGRPRNTKYSCYDSCQWTCWGCW